MLRPAKRVPMLLGLVVGTALSTPPLDHTSDFELPPPLKPRPKPESARSYTPALPESDDPWVVPDEALERFAERAAVYRAFVRGFVCDESVGLTRYDRGGETAEKKRWRHAYHLSGEGTGLVEERLAFRKDGSVGPSRARFRDDRRFPPAYAWLLLFDENNRALLSLRHAGERVEGYGLVHEIHFRGGMPWRGGSDIREWEGTMLVDAATSVPLSVVAEPRGQQARLEEVFRRWARSTKITLFNVLTFATKPEARGFRARIEFDRLHEGLRFPTRARYDTFAMVSPEDQIPVMASTRSYDGYRFTEVDVGEEQIEGSAR